MVLFGGFPQDKCFSFDSSSDIADYHYGQFIDEKTCNRQIISKVV